MADPHDGKLVTQKKNEVLTHATAWINLENMLSKRSRSQKTTYCTIHLYEMARIGESKELEGRLVVARLGGEEGWGVTADGLGASLGDEESVLN